MTPRRVARVAAVAALAFRPAVAPVVSFACLALVASTAHAQAPRTGASRDRTEDLTLAVGETKTISAKDVRNYNDSGQGVIEIKLTPDGGQFVIVGKKAGSTTLLLIKNDGTQITYEITVTQRPMTVVSRELQQLIEGTPGLRLRQVGARIFIEGGVATEGELKRVQQIAALYPGQVESLVTLGSGAADRKTLVRIDFFFIQYDRTSSYNVGIGWPDNIGGINNGSATVQSTLSYDFAARASTAATASVVNQPLPSLDIASSNGWAKVMHQASILTANGSEANFSSGGVKNVVVTFGINQTLQQIKFGVDMTVLPRYDAQNREIEMNLKADVLELTPPVQGTVPSQDVTKINTLINLKLGQALVLSGIRTRSVRHNITGLPLLSEIPVLGVLFGAHNNQAEDVEGAVFIIPSIIETVPKSAVEVIKNALSQFKDYSGDVDQVESFNKTPPSAR
jgi:pilus assembly protein CpaC